MGDDAAADDAAEAGGRGGKPRYRPRYQRNETTAQRLDRNYSELLQELRVAQAGVQILFAFLLSIAFQQRFASVTSFERVAYLVSLICAAVAAILLVAPVAAHRLMFGQRLKDELVAFASVLAEAGLVSLALSMLTAVLLIIEIVANLALAIVVVTLLGLLVAAMWYAAPIRALRKAGRNVDLPDARS